MKNTRRRYSPITGDPGSALLQTKWDLTRGQGTVLAECWRPTSRRTYFVSVQDLQHALDAYLRYYKYERPYQGYRLRSRTPAEVFHSAAS